METAGTHKWASHPQIQSDPDCPSSLPSVLGRRAWLWGGELGTKQLVMPPGRLALVGSDLPSVLWSPGGRSLGRSGGRRVSEPHEALGVSSKTGQLWSQGLAD